MGSLKKNSVNFVQSFGQLAATNIFMYIQGVQKNFAVRVFAYSGNNFRSFFSIKVSSESSIFELFHVVFLLDLKTTKICYNHFFECKSKIEFPDLFKFTVFHILKYEKI